MWIPSPSVYPSVYAPEPLYRRRKHSSDFQEVRPFFTKTCPANHGHTFHPRPLNVPLYSTTVQYRAVSQSASDLHGLSNSNSPNVKLRYNIKKLSSSSSNYYGKARTFETRQRIPCDNYDTALCCGVQSSDRLPAANATDVWQMLLTVTGLCRGQFL
jgi:hypothetical protein